MSKKKIKLAYITNAMLTLKDAQSVQISSMGIAFQNLLQDKFVLKSPRVSSEFEASFWRPSECIFSGGILRYLEMTIRMFLWLIWVRPERVFTRDIVLASLSAVMGFNVVYEFHKECRTLTHELLYRILRKRIKVVAISQALGDFLVHAYKTPAKNILVAHDAVFLEEYDLLREKTKDELRKELGLPSSQKIMLHTGSLYSGRGIGLFELVLEEFPELYGLSVGGKEEDVDIWRERYSRYENMHFIPHQDRKKLIKYQVAADILFFPMTRKNPIWWCTSPMKLFEYMATGNVILGSALGSSGEVLNEDNAVIFDPDNHKSISAGILKILEGEIDVQKLASTALSDIRLHYTWDKRARRILSFISPEKLAL